MAGGDFLLARQQAGLQNHFMIHTRRRLDDGSHIAPHQVIVAGFQAADIDDHVQHSCAMRDRLKRFSDFRVGGLSAERKSDRDPDLDLSSPQRLRPLHPHNREEQK